MPSVQNPRAILRKILQEPEILIAPGAHDAFTARIIEQAGFSAIYRAKDFILLITFCWSFIKPTKYQ